VSLPDLPSVTDEMLHAIASRQGLNGASISRPPQVGIFNAIYGLGDDLIVRVPRNHLRFIGAMRNETVAVPLARAAGVRTPALVAFDDTLDILPVPYSIYERVPGTALELLPGDPAYAASVWHELGRDLARLHLGVERTGPATRLLVWDQKTDPHPLPEIIARAGYFTSVEANWLTSWLDRLAPYVESAPAPRFLHGDTQASNVIADPRTRTYNAVIDWGSCLWDDIALDFSGISLRAVPALLEGYRQIAGSDDETIEARILWQHLRIALHQLRGQPKPQSSWAERPIGMPLDILLFFTGDHLDGKWRQWAPRPRP
jgi:aminoglycoside phosphotransferase (APT) family kinase protein